MNVLFVCTGNICRSPLAELLLRARPAGAGILASSAGTHALEGRPMDAAAALVARELGLDPSGHRARTLTPVAVAGADLVLTATSALRDEVADAHPGASARIFTLREFARHATGTAGTAADRIAAAGRVAEGERVGPPTPSLDDIGDPFGAPLGVMRDCARRIDAAVTDLLAVLAPDTARFRENRS